LYRRPFPQAYESKKIFQTTHAGRQIPNEETRHIGNFICDPILEILTVQMNVSAGNPLAGSIEQKGTPTFCLASFVGVHISLLTELQRHAEDVSRNPKDWMPWNYRETIERNRGDPSASG
jgi:hypothetical protein